MSVFTYDNDIDLYFDEMIYESQLSIIEALYNIDNTELVYKKSIRYLDESSNDYQNLTQNFQAVLESDLEAFWEKLYGFYQKVLQKIKEFFAFLVRYFDALTKDAKEFVTKYEEKLIEKNNKGNLEGFYYFMYNYNNDEINSKQVKDIFGFINHAMGNDDIKNSTIEEIEKMEENYEMIMEGVRGIFLGDNGKKYTSDQFTKALFSLFRNGAESEKDKKDIPIKISYIINVLKNTGGLGLALGADKLLKDEYNQNIETMKKMEYVAKNHESANEDEKQTITKVLKFVRIKTKYFQGAQTIMFEYIRAKKIAIAERDSTYKTVCMKAFRHKSKESEPKPDDSRPGLGTGK